METSEFINRAADRTTEFLEAYEGGLGMDGAKSRVAVLRTELRRILCDEFKDRRIASIRGLKDKLTIEKGYNPVVGAIRIRRRATVDRTIRNLGFDRVGFIYIYRI